MTERQHEVAAWGDPDSLQQRVAGFVASGLHEGARVVIISRSAHRGGLDDLLSAQGLDVARARRDGHLTTLGADESLDGLMVGGRLDPDRFDAFVRPLLAAGDRPLHAYGEMVALLWERGEVAAALELESMWNAVIAGRPVRLLCAYPAGELAAADLGDVARLCGLHDRVSLAGPHPGAGATVRVGDVVWSSVHLPVPAAVGSVRRFVRDALTGWGLDDLVGDAVLVTSELATNAVTHGGSPFRTSLVRGDRAVRVCVEDGSRTWPELHHALPGDQDGRGMAIVASLSRRTGCDPTTGVKDAWAELSV